MFLIVACASRRARTMPSRLPLTSVIPALSIAIAASIYGAQAIGAGRTDRLDAVLRTALTMNLVLTGALVALGRG